MEEIELWRHELAKIPQARTVMVVQLTTTWLTEPLWAQLRDDLDLSLFHTALLAQHPYRYRRFLLYDLPSDAGGDPGHYKVTRVEHDAWLTRVRRQLAFLGDDRHTGDGRRPYAAKVVIPPRAGQPEVDVPDGIWVDCLPPRRLLDDLNKVGAIALDPHEENIVGPHGDRNPLWLGSMT